jgi:hypothetical protein
MDNSGSPLKNLPMTEAGGECEQCGDPLDDHAMIPTAGDPREGGVMLCPVPGCLCLATWSVPPFSERGAVLVPDLEELAAMRAFVQKVHLN